MFEEVNSLAGWSVDNLPSNHLALISSEKTDGSFLLNHFISLFLKADVSVLFLCASQGFPHYNVICSKLGVNLERARDGKKLEIVDLLDAHLKAYVEAEISPDDDVAFVPAFQQQSAKSLYQAISGRLNLNEKNLIVLDDLTVLLSVGFAEADLINFVHYMRALASTHDCTFVTHFQRDLVSEQHGQYLYEYCQLYSDCEFQVRGLESGYCKDVHGTLDFVCKSRDVERRQTTTHMQYKLTDRTVKLFAPGTSAAVL